MLAAAWSAEFPTIRFNTLWPQHAVATLAITNSWDLDLGKSATVAHMADPAYRIVTSLSHTRFYKDADALTDMGVMDQAAWKVDPASDELYDDFMIEPLGVRAGQCVEYRQLPSDVALHSLLGNHVLLLGAKSATALIEGAATEAGATVRVAELTADVKAIEAIMEAAELDAIFISAGPASLAGTLETSAEAWEIAFGLHCKAPYYCVAKAMPLLRRSNQPRVVMVAPAPMCHPQGFSAGVPCAVMAQVRGLYVIGMAEEFSGSGGKVGVRINAIWDGMAHGPAADKSLELLAFDSGLSGGFYAATLVKSAVPHDRLPQRLRMTPKRGC